MIPKLHYISQGNSAREHLEHIQKACTAGAELVQLGLKNVSDKKLLKLAQEVREITSHFQTRLIISHNYKIAKEVKADGVFVEQADTCPSIVRKYVYTWQLIGATANNLQECETLMAKEVDYICLKPFRSTTKNTIYTVLGLNGYTAIVEALNTKTPIIGAGGITTVNIMPGSGHLMSGQTVYLKTKRVNTVEKMILCNETNGICGGMKMANGTNSIQDKPFPGTRGRSAAIVRELFYQAIDYKNKIEAAEDDPDKIPPFDIGLNAVVEILDGKRIVHHHTHRADDILTVLR